EPIVEVETDKATLEVPSPVAGVLTEQLVATGDTVAVGAVVARIDEAKAAARAPQAEEPSSPEAPAQPAARRAQPQPERVQQPAAAASQAPAAVAEKPAGQKAASVMPAAQRLLDEHGLSADDVPATGPGGRLLKEDVLRYLE